MKVVVMPYMRSALSLADMPAVRKMQKDMKSDSFMLDYCQNAARIATRSKDKFQIFGAVAEIAKNERVSAFYTEDSGTLDIWISCLAFCPGYRFLDLGFYLSDLWMSVEENAEEVRSHMLIDAYIPSEEESEI